MPVQLKAPVRLMFVVFAGLLGCTSPANNLPPLETVPYVDLQRYAGIWYEIARLPQPFQKECLASRAVYTLREDGQLGVLNECRIGSMDGPLKAVQGRARVVDPSTNAKLEVSFFWPFWGDYWIIDLDAEYRWAVVGHPGRKYLWILARQETLDPAIRRGIELRLKQQGYELTQLIIGPANKP